VIENVVRLELCFSVGEPEGHTLGIHVEGVFKDQVSTRKLILQGFSASCNVAAWGGHGIAVRLEKPCEELVRRKEASHDSTHLMSQLRGISVANMEERQPFGNGPSQ
jgi:hypothetical protein